MCAGLGSGEVGSLVGASRGLPLDVVGGLQVIPLLLDHNKMVDVIGHKISIMDNGQDTREVKARALRRKGADWLKLEKGDVEER